MPLPDPFPTSIKLTDLTSYLTDSENGRLLELWDSTVQAMIDVRQQVKEEKLRPLLIAELERLGYRVIPPSEQYECSACGHREMHEVGRSSSKRETIYICRHCGWLRWKLSDPPGTVSP